MFFPCIFFFFLILLLLVTIPNRLNLLISILPAMHPRLTEVAGEYLLSFSYPCLHSHPDMPRILLPFPLTRP